GPSMAVSGGSTLSGDAVAPHLAVAGVGLHAEGVSKSFGGVRALHDVTFDAPPGQITGLIGANGSGKTTFLNLVFGYYRLDAGTIRVGTNDITGLAPHRVVSSGVARTFQTPPVVPRL